MSRWCMPWSCCRNRRGGSVLILVLWTLFVLASLAVALGARVSSLVRAAGFSQARLEARAQAFSAVAMAQAQIADASTNAWDGPVAACWTCDPEVFGGAFEPEAREPGFRVYHVIDDGDGGARTNAGIVGVESRIHLNRADQTLLEMFLRRTGGLPANAAAATAKRIVLARSDGKPAKPKRASGAVYLREPVPEREGPDGAAAPSGGLPSVWSLLELQGMDEASWLRVAPYLTVYGSGSINLNAAPRPVLDALFTAVARERQTDRTVEELVDRLLELREEGRLLEGKSVTDWLAILREGGELSPESGKLIQNAAKWADVGSSCWEGTAEGRGGSVPPFTVRIDFVIDGETGSVVQWREW